ncbi:uncharacterized protein ASCRUDRAFT_19628, partial [Ascoidea rubescens DSM 1968]
DNKDNQEYEKYEEWNGFGSSDTPIITKPILKKRTVLQFKSNSKRLENTPANGETTVTIEPLNANGLDSDTDNSLSFEEIAKANFVDLTRSNHILKKSVDRATTYAKFIESAQPDQFITHEPKKKNKKKFRYLSKSERKDNRRRISLKKAKR